MASSITKNASVATIAQSNWTNADATHLGAIDQSYATNVRTAYSADYINLSAFAFGVPAGATILGIGVRIIFNNASTRTTNIEAALSKDLGSNYTAFKVTNTTGTTDIDYTFGGASDLWGTTFADTDFADANFMLQIRAYTSNTSGAVRLDYVEVAVYYGAIIYTMSTLPASYVLTGLGASFHKVYVIITAPATFILTGMSSFISKSGIIQPIIKLINIIKPKVNSSVNKIKVTTISSLKPKLNSSINKIKITIVNSLKPKLK